MSVNKRDIPLEILNNFVGLKQFCQDIQIRNSSFLLVDFNDLTILLRDISSEGKFYFKIERPKLSDGEVRSKIIYKPYNKTNLKAPIWLGYSSYPLLLIPEEIDSWVKLVKEYQVVSLDVNDRFLNQYHEEYIEELRSLDEDADTKPFNEKQQIFLFYGLEEYEKVIEATQIPSKQKEEILRDIKDLKKRISTLTKSQVISLLARLKAKIKLAGVNFVMEVIKKVPDAFAKIIAEKSLNFAGDQLHHLVNHFI